MISRLSSGCHTSITASQTSRAKSSSVSVKISGLYWKPNTVSPPSSFSAYRITNWVPSTAICRVASRSLRKTTRRKSGAVALYRCTVARSAPTRLSMVRSISSSRAWVSTEIVTSSGIASSSMSERTKSKSVRPEAGKPISISL